LTHNAPFKVSATWPKSPAASVRDVAHIRISIGGDLLTQLADVETNVNRDYLRASAVSMALWFADNWWRLRWESLRNGFVPSADWRMRHELTFGPGGTMWPPLMIYGTGTSVVLAPTFGAKVSSGPLRFLDLTNVWSIEGKIFEVGFDEFFGSVTAACSNALDGPALASLLDELRQERADPELAAWRSLEARLGYDPDEAPDGLIEGLSAMENALGERAVEEAAVAAPGERAQRALEEAVEASKASSIIADLDVARTVDLSALQSASSTPWQLAEYAASKVRETIGMREGPILGHPFADILGVRWEELKEAPATARRLEYAARLKQKRTSERLALQSKPATDRRFELSRMIGDSIWSANENFGVVSRAKTERQKFQRAFAQSLLCPFSEVRNHVELSGPTEKQIADAAKYFHVRPSVVQTLLVNKGVLPRETLAERLEAA
jgi:hypothetical protein